MYWIRFIQKLPQVYLWNGITSWCGCNGHLIAQLACQFSGNGQTIDSVYQDFYVYVRKFMLIKCLVKASTINLIQSCCINEKWVLDIDKLHERLLFCETILRDLEVMKHYFCEDFCLLLRVDVLAV